MTLIACSCTARKIAYISLYYCKTAAFTIRSLFTLNRKNVIKISTDIRVSKQKLRSDKKQRDFALKCKRAAVNRGD